MATSPWLRGLARQGLGVACPACWPTGPRRSMQDYRGRMGGGRDVTPAPASWVDNTPRHDLLPVDLLPVAPPPKIAPEAPVKRTGQDHAPHCDVSWHSSRTSRRATTLRRVRSVGRSNLVFIWRRVSRLAANGEGPAQTKKLGVSQGLATPYECPNQAALRRAGPTVNWRRASAPMLCSCPRASAQALPTVMAAPHRSISHAGLHWPVQ